jgi:integrase/recombinase XerD
VVNLKVEDYYPSGKRFLLRFKEKGGKEKELPVHHKLEELLDEYLKASGLGNEQGSPLFPAALGKTGKLSRRRLVRTDAADMLKRRLKQTGLPAHYSPHSFRATGITNFLENDGTLEAAQRIAGHADSRTTKLYDRRGQKVLLEDMDSILAVTVQSDLPHRNRQSGRFRKPCSLETDDFQVSLRDGHNESESE